MSNQGTGHIYANEVPAGRVSSRGAAAAPPRWSPAPAQQLQQQATTSAITLILTSRPK